MLCGSDRSDGDPLPKSAGIAFFFFFLNRSSCFLPRRPSCHHLRKLTWRFFILPSSDAELQTVCSSSLFIYPPHTLLLLSDRQSETLVAPPASPPRPPSGRFTEQHRSLVHVSPHLTIILNPRRFVRPVWFQSIRRNEGTRRFSSQRPTSVNYLHVIYTLQLYLNGYFISFLGAGDICLTSYKCL